MLVQVFGLPWINLDSYLARHSKISQLDVTRGCEEHISS